MKFLKKPLKIPRLSFLSLIFLFFLIAFLIFGFYSLFNDKEVRLSKQQRELVEQFGYPNTFILAFGEMAVAGEYKPVRFEVWNYDRLGRRFYFVDGQFQKDADIEFLENAHYPDLRPSQFSQNTSWEKVKKIIGTPPRAQAEIRPEIMEDTIVYDFWGQVKVAVKDDKLVYIQTYPVIVNE